MKKTLFLIICSAIVFAGCIKKGELSPPENDLQRDDDLIAGSAGSPPEDDPDDDDYLAVEDLSPPEDDLGGEEYHGYDDPVIAYFEIEASSELHNSTGWYGVAYLRDKTYRSWAEGARGNGIGESFTLDLGGYYREPQLAAGFALKNGYGDLNHYNKNNRVKAFKIYIDGLYSETIAIKGSIHFEQYAFKAPVECVEIRFVIDDVYPGTEYDDTCVAEIAPLRYILRANNFHENILFLMGPPDEGMTEYWSHNDQILARRVQEVDKMVLLEHMPFDIPVDLNYYLSGKGWINGPLKTKVARLNGNGQSSLRLTNNLPRLDGATAMYPLYSSFVHAVYPEIPFGKASEDEKIDWRWPYAPNAETLRMLWEWGIPEELPGIVQCNQTAKAYQRLINGETDIVFCYEPSDAEIKAAAEKGLSFHLTPIAKDAFVFLVKNKNILNNITRRQIRDIYSGRITNWKSISGVDDVIIAYQRRQNSGSQTIMQSIMGQSRPLKPIFDGEPAPSHMFSVLRMVASDYYNYNSAIGYSFLFYLTKMIDNPGVKILSVNGVAPTKQAIQNNTYPFSQIVYAVTTGSESENTKKFIDWIVSTQGQELVEKTGYTPLR